MDSTSRSSNASPNGNTEKLKRILPKMVLYPNHVPDIAKSVGMLRNMGYDMIVNALSNPAFEHREVIENGNNHQLFTRSDLMLEPYHWCNEVIHKTTVSINCDSLDKNHEENSSAILQQELKWAKYLKSPTQVLVALAHNSSMNLSRGMVRQFDDHDIALMEIPIVNKELFTNRYMQSNNHIRNGVAAATEMWKRWNQFQMNCEFRKNFKIALELTIKMPDRLELKRWFSEPVAMIIISANHFVSSMHSDGAVVELKPEVQMVCLEFIKRYSVGVAIKCNPEVNGRAKGFVECFKDALLNNNIDSHQCDGNGGILKIPSNREDLIEDPKCDFFIRMMWEKYKEAILLAVEGRLNAKDIKKAFVMICGSHGLKFLQSTWSTLSELGGLVQFLIYEENINIRREIQDFVEHHNIATIHTIGNTNEIHFYGKMDIVAALCPEIIHQSQWLHLNFNRVRDYVASDAILIPKQSSMHITPIMSSRIHVEYLAETFQFRHRNTPKHILNKQRELNIGSSHVRYVCECSDEAKMFDIQYSVEILSNVKVNRHKKFDFVIEQDCLLTGFGGYFEAVLYGDVKIIGRGCNDGSRNCTPITYIPIANPQQLKGGDHLKAEIWLNFHSLRRTFWYEWCTLSPHLTKIQNLAGRSICMEYE